MPLELDFKWTPEGTAMCEVLILGPPDAGKSFFAARFAPLLVDDPQRILVFGPPSAKYIAAELNVPYVPVSTTDRKAQEETLRPYFTSPRCELWICDEFDTLMTMGGRGYGCATLHELVQTGRSLGKSYIGIAHGSPYVAKSAINNAGLVFIARSQEPGIIEYANKWMSHWIDDPGQLISHLPKYTFLVWSPPSSNPFMGYARVGPSGQIETYTPQEVESWSKTETPEANTPDPSKTSDNAEPPSPADTADSAAKSSPTDAPPDTA